MFISLLSLEVRNLLPSLANKVGDVRLGSGNDLLRSIKPYKADELLQHIVDGSFAHLPIGVGMAVG